MFFFKPKTIDSIVSDITTKIEALQDLVVHHKWLAAQKQEKIAFVQAEEVEAVKKLEQQIADVHVSTGIVVDTLEAEVFAQQQEAERAQKLVGNFLALIS
jgi:hypothetical protein